MLAQTYRGRVSAISAEQARHNEMPASSAQLPLVAWAGLPSGHVAGVIGQASSCGAWPSTSVLRKYVPCVVLGARYEVAGRLGAWLRRHAATCSPHETGSSASRHCGTHAQHMCMPVAPVLTRC